MFSHLNTVADQRLLTRPLPSRYYSTLGGCYCELLCYGYYQRSQCSRRYTAIARYYLGLVVIVIDYQACVLIMLVP